MTVSVNIAANMLGRAWTAVIGLICVPLYLHFLSVEAYGLVGVLVTLQSVLAVADLGLSLALNREFARASVADVGPGGMGNTLRTLEIVYWTASLIVGGIVAALAPRIATHWITDTRLPVATLEHAMMAIGAIVALQLPFSLYQAGLLGLQRQVVVNVIVGLASTLRSLGAIAVLWLVSPTIEALLWWQAGVAFVSTSVIAVILWRRLPGSLPARFDMRVLSATWRFSLAVSGNAIVGVFITQADKAWLTKFVSLEQFGFYTLSAVAAGFMSTLAIPINMAIFPRFAQLAQLGDSVGLSAVYHKACQLMAVALMPIGVLLVVFPFEMLSLWTGNAHTARSAAVSLVPLAIGWLLNGLVSVGASLQSAVGWPGLMLRTNAIMALVLTPAFAVAIPRFGVLGAAMGWVVANLAYVVCTIPLMHRRYLRGELRTWYLADVMLPFVAAVAVAAVARVSFLPDLNRVKLFAYLGSTWLLATIAVLAVVPRVRHQLWALFVQRMPENWASR